MSNNPTDLDTHRKSVVRARLLKIQRILEARGVRDIKVDFNHNATFLEVAEGLSKVLEAYLDGKYHPAPPFNDSPRSQDV